MCPPEIPPFGPSPPGAAPPAPDAPAAYGAAPGGGYPPNPPGAYPVGPPGYPGYPPPGGYPPGDPYGQLRTHPLATVSLVCGILSIPMCCCWGLGFPLEITSLACGVLALQKIKAAPDHYRGTNQCIAGMICASVGLLFTLGWLFSSVSNTVKRTYGGSLGI